MLGVHRDLRPQGKAFFEYLRIEQTDAGISYLASPLGRAATAFKLVEASNNRAVFENPEHDFPQHIIYWLDDTDSLHARVEGTIKGELRTEEWIWTRSPNPGSGVK